MYNEKRRDMEKTYDAFIKAYNMFGANGEYEGICFDKKSWSEIVRLYRDSKENR